MLFKPNTMLYMYASSLTQCFTNVPVCLFQDLHLFYPYVIQVLPVYCIVSSYTCILFQAYFNILIYLYVIQALHNVLPVYFQSLHNAFPVYFHAIHNVLPVCFSDTCKKVAIAFDDVVSSIEFVNCQSIQAQVGEII